jgi:hypothetical protein
MNEQEQKEHDEAVARVREANSRVNTDRIKLIEQVADNSDADRAQDFDEAAQTELRAAQEEAEAKRLQTEGITVEDEPETVVEDADTKQVNGETYYRQIVNGAEKWQSLKEIRTAASKVDGADEYLRQAAESVKNASRLALSPQKDEPSDLGEAEWADLLARNALGDVEATKILASRLASKPSVTPDVLRTIDQRLSFRTELAQLEAKSSDLLENQYTQRLFRDRLAEMREENPTMGLSEAYTSIDKELRAAFPGITKTKTPDKLERKRTLVNVPTSVARQTPVVDDEGEEDVSEVINKIAKARGSVPVMHGLRRER